MREIRFRVFDTERKKYAVDEDWSLGVKSQLIRGKYGEEFPEMIVEQYTGLKDNSGKEIYEGDITNYGVVEWFNSLVWDSGGSDHSGFYINPIGYDLYENELEYHLGFDNNIEIIGNIHENPELLKK